MKILIISCLVALVIMSAYSVAVWTIDFGGDGAQSMKLNYLYNDQIDITEYEFVEHINQELSFYQSTTAICFRMQENATDIQSGDNGFGLGFACLQPGGCSDGTKFSVSLYSSYLDSLSPPIWHAGVLNYTAQNTGVLYSGNSTDFDTTFNLSLAVAQDLTLPLPTELARWRCYFNFKGNVAKTRLN